MDVKVPGQRPRHPLSTHEEEFKALRRKLYASVLDEGELLPEAEFELTHPSAWKGEHA